jgi:hypothetical protein
MLVRSARVEVAIGSPIVPTKGGPAARDQLRASVRSALVDLSGLRAAPNEAAGALD